MDEKKVKDGKEFQELLAEIDEKREYYRNHPEESRKNMMQKWKNDQESINNPTESAKKLKMTPADSISERYDRSNDILYMTFDDLYDSNSETIIVSLEKDICLFFDKEFKFPIQIRITNATKKLKVKTYSLRNYFDFKFKISVKTDLITVQIWFKFKIHGKIQNPIEFTRKTPNEKGIPQYSIDITNFQSQTDKKAKV